MPLAESETGNLGFHHSIDASPPPGTFPPPPDEQPAVAETPPPASKLEAVFSREKPPLETAAATMQSLRYIVLDVNAQLNPPQELASELEEIFSNPVRRVLKKSTKRPPKSPELRTPRSINRARREHGLKGHLQARIETTPFGGEFFVYEGTTKQGEAWVIGTPAEGFRLPPQEQPYKLNGARKDLGRRQDRFEPNSDADLRHDKNVKFFYVNWDKLIPLFYDGEIPQGATYRRYAEVFMNDLAIESQTESGKTKLTNAGSIDFVGELPDGQLVIIDFRTPNRSKTRQLAKHTRGLQEILRQHNSEELPRISQFIGVYQDIESSSLIKLLPRREQYLPYMETPKEAIIYQASAAD